MRECISKSQISMNFKILGSRGWRGETRRGEGERATFWAAALEKIRGDKVLYNTGGLLRTYVRPSVRPSPPYKRISASGSRLLLRALLRVICNLQCQISLMHMVVHGIFFLSGSSVSHFFLFYRYSFYVNSYS